MTQNNNTLDIISNNIPFTVRIVAQGDKYGLNNVLTHNKEEPLVEFYDKRYPHTQFGQFVSSYYMSTMLQHDKNVGLALEGSIPEWSIKAREMSLVNDWLSNTEFGKQLENGTIKKAFKF